MTNISAPKTDSWNSSPNFLLVDYYNHGSYPGSVFEVAAQHNNVTYNRKCCGPAVRSAAGPAVVMRASTVGLMSLLVTAIVIFW